MSEGVSAVRARSFRCMSVIEANRERRRESKRDGEKEREKEGGRRSEEIAIG